jgi:hypothetical protein
LDDAGDRMVWSSTGDIALMTSNGSTLRSLRLLRWGLAAVIAACSLAPLPVAAAGIWEDVLRNCGSQLNSMPIHASMPAGRKAATIHPRTTGGRGPETCADFTWLKVVGPPTTVGITWQGKPTVNSWDCGHSSMAWGLYRKTASGGTWLGGGGSMGAWKNNQCVYDFTGQPATSNWGSFLLGTLTSAQQEYRMAFVAWSHDSPDLGHTANYCADPESCYWPVKFSMNGAFTSPKADYTVWRPSTGTWHVLDSTTWTSVSQQWGRSTDTPVRGDFDGDGRSDFAVWRSSDGTWRVIKSSTGTSVTQQWGQSGDKPVPADYDGDGKTDYAIWRPSDGYWHVIGSSTGGVVSQQWGASSDVPVPALYDDDLRADFAVWRPSTGDWHIINSLSGTIRRQQWGQSGDKPVPGSYTSSDYLAQPAVWRPSDGVWYIGHPAGWWWFQWGASGDIPVPADFDGDGVFEYVVFRPSDGKWYHRLSTNGAMTSVAWGMSGDKPMAPFFR